MSSHTDQRLKVRIEKCEDGSYTAYNTNGSFGVAVGSGETIPEARDDFRNSLTECIEVLKEEGKRIPVELEEEPIFEFDLSSLFDYFKVLKLSELGSYLGINPSLLRQYKRGSTYISDTRLKEIEAGIHRLGAELETLRLI